MDKIIVTHSRGPDGPYIVEYKGSYYLVSTQEESVSEAKPIDRPDMFLKFGYFEQIDSIPVMTLSRIQDILRANEIWP